MKHVPPQRDANQAHKPLMNVPPQVTNQPLVNVPPDQNKIPTTLAEIYPLGDVPPVAPFAIAVPNAVAGMPSEIATEGPKAAGSEICAVVVIGAIILAPEISIPALARFPFAAF
jgi:hypothetical protein